MDMQCTYGLHGQLGFATVSAQDHIFDSQDGSPASETQALIHESLRPLVTKMMHVVYPLGFTGQTETVAATLGLLLGTGSNVETSALPDLLKPFVLTPIGRELVAAASMDLSELRQREEQLRELRELQGQLDGMINALPAANSKADIEQLQRHASKIQSGLELIAKRSSLAQACPETRAACEAYKAEAAQWAQALEALTESAWGAAAHDTVDSDGQINPAMASGFKEGCSYWRQLAATRAVVTVDVGFVPHPEGKPPELHDLQQVADERQSRWQQAQLWHEQWACLLETLFELHELNEGGRQRQQRIACLC